MRALALLPLLLVAGCGPDFWNQPAQPAPSGVSATHNGLDPIASGAEPDFRARGSVGVFGGGPRR